MAGSLVDVSQCIGLSDIFFPLANLVLGEFIDIDSKQPCRPTTTNRPTFTAVRSIMA